MYLISLFSVILKLGIVLYSKYKYNLVLFTNRRETHFCSGSPFDTQLTEHEKSLHLTAAVGIVFLFKETATGIVFFIVIYRKPLCTTTNFIKPEERVSVEKFSLEYKSIFNLLLFLL